MGKGGAKTLDSDPTAKVEVLIGEKAYDVTNFRHPGGTIIGFYAGKGSDATEAFNNFHIRSKKAKKILEHLPSRPINKEEKIPGQASLLEDFNRLQADLQKEGFFKPSIPHVIFRITEVVLMHAAGFWLLFNGHIILGSIILGIVSGRCGWLMHEGGHISLTGNIFIDKSLQVLIYGLGCGMSASWWRSQHNRHHSMPQKLGHDVDLNTLPLVCFNEKVAKRMGLSQKVWIRAQAICFPLITTLLVALGWQFYLHPRHVVRVKNIGEASVLIARCAIFYGTMVPRFGLANALGLYLIYTWIGSNYIFLNFAVSHTHLPVVPKDDNTVDWVRYSAVYTMNVHPGPFKFISWWMSYLNFQIEHHLFPSMPQFRHPLISPRVRAFFEKHGLKYDQRSYIEAMQATFANLHKVGHDVFLG